MPDGPDPEPLLNLTQEKVVVLERDGSYRYLNAATAEVIGFEPAELEGTDAFSLVHPDDQDRVREGFERVVAGEARSDEPVEYRHATADGGWVWLRTRVHTPEETGIEGYVLTSRDVTREVESRRRLETLASVSPDVFWMFTADWSELLFINDAVETVYDVSTEQINDDPQVFLESIHPEDRPYVQRAMKQLSRGEPIRIDYRIGQADEATRWVRVPGEPVKRDGDVVAVTGFARDVTDEYRRDRQLAVMDNLLRHTIRNDMNIIDGTASRIADCVKNATAFDPEAWTADDETPAAADPDDATTADGDAPCTPTELAELAADLAEHAETIRRVASDLLTTAEKQRGVIDLLRQRGSPQSVAIAPVVEEAIDMVVDDRGGHDAVEVRYSDPAAATPVDDSPEDDAVPVVSVSYPRDVHAFTHPELDYAIAELVRNAFDHATSTPSVRLAVTETPESVDISIRDNCPPIPPDERYVISDRWEMDDLRHTGGMGLWLVYWVAKRSGGDLSFDTHEHGNVVTLSVPSAEQEMTDVDSAAMAPPTRSQTSANRVVGNSAEVGRSDGTAPERTGDADSTRNGTGPERNGTDPEPEPETQTD